MERRRSEHAHASYQDSSFARPVQPLYGAGRKEGYLPFTRENRKFQLENQMVRTIPFGKLQKIWAVI